MAGTARSKRGKAKKAKANQKKVKNAKLKEVLRKIPNEKVMTRSTNVEQTRASRSVAKRLSDKGAVANTKTESTKLSKKRVREASEEGVPVVATRITRRGRSSSAASVTPLAVRSPPMKKIRTRSTQRASSEQTKPKALKQLEKSVPEKSTGTRGRSVGSLKITPTRAVAAAAVRVKPNVSQSRKSSLPKQPTPKVTPSTRTNQKAKKSPAKRTPRPAPAAKVVTKETAAAKRRSTGKTKAIASATTTDSSKSKTSSRSPRTKQTPLKLREDGEAGPTRGRRSTQRSEGSTKTGASGAANSLPSLTRARRSLNRSAAKSESSAEEMPENPTAQTEGEENNGEVREESTATAAMEPEKDGLGEKETKAVNSPPPPPPAAQGEQASNPTESVEDGKRKREDDVSANEGESSKKVKLTEDEETTKDETTAEEPMEVDEESKPEVDGKEVKKDEASPAEDAKSGEEKDAKETESTPASSSVADPVVPVQSDSKDVVEPSSGTAESTSEVEEQKKTEEPESESKEAESAVPETKAETKAEESSSSTKEVSKEVNMQTESSGDDGTKEEGGEKKVESKDEVKTEEKKEVSDEKMEEDAAKDAGEEAETAKEEDSSQVEPIDLDSKKVPTVVNDVASHDNGLSSNEEPEGERKEGAKEETEKKVATPTTNGVNEDAKESADLKTNSSTEKGCRKFARNAHLSKLVDEVADGKFSLVSYNLRELDGSVEQHAELIGEIDGLDADVLCLQDVDKAYFDGKLEQSLKGKGYDGVYHENKGGSKGLAILCKTGAFELVSHKGCDVHELVRKDVDNTSLDDKDKTALLSFLLKSASVLYAKLKSVKAEKSVCICNSTLPAADDHSLHALQLAVMVRELTSQSEGTGNPHLLCGTFNLEEEYPGFQVLKDGYLNSEMIEDLQGRKDVPIPEKENAALIDLLWKCFQHPSSSLKSSYNVVLGDDVAQVGKQRMIAKDSLWFSSESLHVVGVLDLDPDDVTRSKHVSLKADLIFANNETKNVNDSSLTKTDIHATSS